MHRPDESSLPLSVFLRKTRTPPHTQVSSRCSSPGPIVPQARRQAAGMIARHSALPSLRVIANARTLGEMGPGNKCRDDRRGDAPSAPASRRRSGQRSARRDATRQRSARAAHHQSFRWPSRRLESRWSFAHCSFGSRPAKRRTLTRSTAGSTASLRRAGGCAPRWNRLEHRANSVRDAAGSRCQGCARSFRMGPPGCLRIDR